MPLPLAAGARGHHRSPRRVEPHRGALVGPDGRAFHVAGEADAAIHALGAQLLLLRAKRVVAGGGQRRLEACLEVSAVVDEPVTVAIRQVDLVRQVGGGEIVPAPDVCWVHGELAGEAVHDAIHGEDRLRPARSAIRRVRRLVGHHAAALDAEIGHPMWAQEMGHRVVGQHDAPGVVGAEVQPDPVTHGEHGAVAPRRDLDIVHLVPRVGSGHHVLATVLRPFDRAAGGDGGGGDQQVLRIAVGLGAEATAHVRRDDSDLVRRQAKGGHQPLLDEVDHLRAVPRGERAVTRVPLRDHPARLDGHADIALDVEAFAHRHIRGGEHGIGVAEAGLEEDGDVVAPLGVKDGRSRFGSRDHVADHGQGLVLDLDQLAAVLSEGAALRQHHGHDLAHEEHAVAAHGELGHLLHGHGHPRGQSRRDGAKEGQRLHPALEIGEGEDVDHAGEPARRVCLHGHDSSVPVRAPDERRVEHARKLDVVDVAAVAAEKAGVFLATYGGSKEFRAHEPSDHTNRPRGCPEIAQRVGAAGRSPLAMARRRGGGVRASREGHLVIGRA